MRTMVFTALFLLAMPVTSAFGQAAGIITGRIMDGDDKPLRGATIRVMGTSPARGAISKENGIFIIRDIPPGTYDIQATAIGFRRILICDVEITGGGINGIGNIALEDSIRQPQDLITVSNPQDIVQAERSGTRRIIGFYPSERSNLYHYYYR